MLKKHYLLYVLLIFCCSCSSDEPLSPEEQPHSVENAYAAQNRWIYGQMNRNYLWRDDLPDSTTCNFNQNTKEFFASILSPKDRFSYLTTNDNYTPSNQSRWGFAYQEYEDRVGTKSYYVLYTLSNTDKITEGDWLYYKSEDHRGIHFSKMRLTETDLLEEIPESDFLINSISGTMQTSSVLRDSIYLVDGDKIGYLCYLEFDDPQELAPSIKYFKENGISELILDLRYNPGGYVSTCLYLCNCIVNESGYGQVFQQCSYNNLLASFYKNTTGSEYTYTYFKQPSNNSTSTIGLGIDGLNLNRIFILTSRHTASASEATIICLRPYMDVVLIGETTVGKGVGSRNFSNSKYKYSIQPIVMRYYNAVGETTPDEGLNVDYIIPNGYRTAKSEMGKIDEPLLHKALSIIAPSSFHSIESRANQTLENSLTPIGEPSYITEFNNKHYNESN